MKAKKDDNNIENMKPLQEKLHSFYILASNNVIYSQFDKVNNLSSFVVFSINIHV